MWLDFLALLAGLLLPLAFAPFNHSIFAFLSPALLLWVILKTKTKKNKRAFYRGFLYGLGQFGLGISWIYISMSVYGGFGKPLAFIITCLLVFLLSLFPACQIYILQRFFPENNHKKYLFIFPSSWALAEYLRTIIGTGFPWLLLGYTQINTPLHTLAPIIGVYGLSFMVCYTSAAGFILLNPKYFFYKSKIIILLSIIILWGSTVLISPLHWTQPGKNLQVSLVQGNISQQLKWEPQELTHILKIYHDLTLEHWDSQLIIWPEAAIPILANQVEDYLNNLSKKSKKHQTSLLIGAPLLKGDSFYNAIITLGNAKNTYLKHHLVPFGEYIPFRNYLNGLFNWLHIPMSDLSPGPNSKKQDLLLAQNIPIAAFICYEIAYPTQVLEAVSKGAELLITLTDDSWFGHSFAPAQHLQIAQMRALETGKYLLFSTNTGISAIIQPNGKLLASLPDFQQGVLTGKIYAMQGNTPLVYISHHIVLIFFLVLLIFTSISRKQFKIQY